MRQRLEGLVTGAALLWERLFRPSSRVGASGIARRVLVLHFPATVGIAVHELPLFQALKELDPPPHVTVATTGSALLRYSPLIDCLIAVPHPARGLRAAARALRGVLAQQNSSVDCVLMGAFDRQRAILRLAWLSAPGWRGGFAEDPRLVQRPLAYDDTRSVAENNLRVAGLLGWRGAALAPRLFVSPGLLARARQLVGDDPRPVLTVISQSSKESSGWVPERMVAVLRLAADRLGFQILLDGTGEQAEAIDRLLAELDGRARSLAGQTSLLEAAAVCALSDVVLGVNTGTTHLAKATGVPTVVLLPAWDDPRHWYKNTPPSVTILHHGQTGAQPEGYAMEEFSVEEVYNALEELATRFPPSPQSREQRGQALLSAVDHLQQ